MTRGGLDAFRGARVQGGRGVVRNQEPVESLFDRLPFGERHPFSSRVD